MPTEKCEVVELSLSFLQENCADAILSSYKLRNIRPYATNYSTLLSISWFKKVITIQQHNIDCGKTIRSLGEHIKAKNATSHDKILLTIFSYNLLPTEIRDKIENNTNKTNSLHESDTTNEYTARK